MMSRCENCLLSLKLKVKSDKPGRQACEKGKVKSEKRKMKNEK